MMVRFGTKTCRAQCGAAVQMGHTCGTLDAHSLASSFLVLGCHCPRFHVTPQVGLVVYTGVWTELFSPNDPLY